MYSLIIFLTAIISLAAGFAVSQVAHYIAGLEKRITELQAAQARHLPYSTADSIEDATAALLKLKFEADFRQDLIDNALNHLRTARNGNRK